MIGTDIQIEQTNNKLIIKDVDNCFCKESDYTLHTCNYLYPSENIFPLQSKYKYTIFKYKIYQELTSSEFNSENDTGIEYYQSIKINQNGLLDLNIKYERS